MRANALSIGVLPSLATDCGATMVSARMTRVQLLANGSVAVERPQQVQDNASAHGNAKARRTRKGASRPKGRRPINLLHVRSPKASKAERVSSQIPRK